MNLWLKDTEADIEAVYPSRASWKKNICAQSVNLQLQVEYPILCVYGVLFFCFFVTGSLITEITNRARTSTQCSNHRLPQCSESIFPFNFSLMRSFSAQLNYKLTGKILHVIICCIPQQALKRIPHVISTQPIWLTKNSWLMSTPSFTQYFCASSHCYEETLVKVFIS